VRATLWRNTRSACHAVRPVTHVVDVVGAGWELDPLDATRRRWWDGVAWTAHVSDGGLSWNPALSLLPPPLLLFAPKPATVGWRDQGDLFAPDASTAREIPVLVQDGGLAAFDPIEIAFGDAAWPAPPPPVVIPSARRKLAPVAIAAATLLIAGGAVASAGILDPDGQRPTVLPELSYRDAEAGFELRYPDSWRVLRRDRNGGIRFAIGASGAPTTETNMVSVVVGATPAPLPQLHSLAEQLTETLRSRLPGVRLEAAARARLAEAPGFHFAFRDPDSTPSTRIEQYVGRTTSGRPLTVTVTIREPRTAPTPEELRDFVASLDPS
jgi:hypothetical protein